MSTHVHSQQKNKKTKNTEFLFEPNKNRGNGDSHSKVTNSYSKVTNSHSKVTIRNESNLKSQLN